MFAIEASSTFQQKIKADDFSCDWHIKGQIVVNFGDVCLLDLISTIIASISTVNILKFQHYLPDKNASIDKQCNSDKNSSDEAVRSGSSHCYSEKTFCEFQHS